MTDKIHVTPKEGLKVPKPETGEFLRPEGENVTKNIHWIRRQTHGEVTIGPAKKAAKKTAVSTKGS